jgi:hypothetical protein
MEFEGKVSIISPSRHSFFLAIVIRIFNQTKIQKYRTPVGDNPLKSIEGIRNLKKQNGLHCPIKTD